jgi:hypothetical protein
LRGVKVVEEQGVGYISIVRIGVGVERLAAGGVWLRLRLVVHIVVAAMYRIDEGLVHPHGEGSEPDGVDGVDGAWRDR